jgi:hypothetical protein
MPKGGHLLGAVSNGGTAAAKENKKPMDERLLKKGKPWLALRRLSQLN